MALAKGALAPVERLSDKVHARLRDEIGSGAITPGTRFVEVEIAARLGVSRTPVREALIRLAREGTLQAGSPGYILPADDRGDALDRLEARRLLDVAIARRAAEAGGDPAPLHEHLRRAEAAHAAGRVKAFATAHYGLRDAIRTLAANAWLSRCAELIDDSFRLARERLYRTPANRRTTLEADTRLVAAITHGNPAEAEAATLDFIATVAAYYQAPTAD